MTVSAFGVLYSLRVHFFERILRANTADMLKLGGTLPPPSEAADPRLLLCASDPDPRRPPRPPPPSLPLPPRPRATGTRSSPLGFATKEKENMARIDARARTHSSDQIANKQSARVSQSVLLRWSRLFPFFLECDRVSVWAILSEVNGKGQRSNGWTGPAPPVVTAWLTTPTDSRWAATRLTHYSHGRRRGRTDGCRRHLSFLLPSSLLSFLHSCSPYEVPFPSLPFPALPFLPPNPLRFAREFSPPPSVIGRRRRAVDAAAPPLSAAVGGGK